MKSMKAPSRKSVVPARIGAADRFPRDFLWGAATSAHQVEGGNRWNDWSRSEREGRVPHASGEACRHWQLYESDFDLARSWGHNAHRFSLEWSRIEPKPGAWDSEALAHYARVVRALRERSMEPIVTLHHFTNPDWFTASGGWLRRDAPALFTRYVERVKDVLGGEVRYWITINEPTIYVLHGFVTGDWPPHARGAWMQAARALRGMARAHVTAYRSLRSGSDPPLVGFAHSSPWIVPCDPSRPADRMAAWVRDLALNRLFLRLIGASRVGQPLDFLGINYYSRTFVRGERGVRRWLGEKCEQDHHPDRGPSSDAGWEVYPPGLESSLERFSRLDIPLIVTENGIATRDERLRWTYLQEHLEALGRAVARGLPVIGYLFWSLMDNFEWALGTEARYGLAEVDFETQSRSPRPAARLLAEVSRTRLVPAKEAFVELRQGDEIAG